MRLISNYICSLASSNNVPKKASKRNLSGDLADDRHVTNAYKRQRCVQRHESTQSSESFNNIVNQQVGYQCKLRTVQKTTEKIQHIDTDLD